MYQKRELAGKFKKVGGGPIRWKQKVAEYDQAIVKG
jgi:hypothetical protein